MLIVSAPSGAGKTSLVRALLQARPGTRLSVSFTTRTPRAGERDGIDYCFIGLDEFEQRERDGEFLESARVHGNCYATSRRWIDERLAEGWDVVLEIDWQGARQVRRLYPEAVSVFILPPSLQVLRERLVGRGQDATDIIDRRVAAARSEIDHVEEFEYVIINQEFSDAAAQLRSIAEAAGLRRVCQFRRHAAVLHSFAPDAAPAVRPPAAAGMRAVPVQD